MVPWSTIDDKACILSCNPCNAPDGVSSKDTYYMVTSRNLRLSSRVMSVGIRTIEIGVAAWCCHQLTSCIQHSSTLCNHFIDFQELVLA
jgi:hypothetical protein